ncbi:MAG: glycosyltransferase family 2 protein [Burkholderiales bacterium]
MSTAAIPALISVVTPFHNTAPYLAQCIESVLAQTHGNFEYLLVDNCSTDGSGEIAKGYAHADPRIRYVRHDTLLPQVANYNRALAQICTQSEFCKIVQADDCIFADCLARMAEAFAQSPRVGLAGSYYLKGTTVRPSGFPLATPYLAGHDMARLYLAGDVWAFGSPTAVMYRAAIVREQRPFFREDAPNEDTEKCMSILERWDFAFVYQVLSFLRVGNESITSSTRAYLPGALDFYIVVRRYGPRFLDPRAAADLERRARQRYYRSLATRALRFPPRGFWKYHAAGLRSLGEEIEWHRVAAGMATELGWMLVNPGMALSGLGRRLRRKSGSAPAVADAAAPVHPTILTDRGRRPSRAGEDEDRPSQSDPRALRDRAIFGDTESRLD